jgi:hypothetical protein
MKNFFGHFIIYASVVLLFSCESNDDASKSNCCDELSVIESEVSNFVETDLDSGWICDASYSESFELKTSSVIVFSSLAGPFTYGTSVGTYNLCTSFTNGSGQAPSKLALIVGKYNNYRKLIPQTSSTFDLSGNVNTPIAIKWEKSSAGKLQFTIGTIDRSVADSTKYQITGNSYLAVKLTDMFPTGAGTSSPAIIGAEDIRAGVYDKKKIAVYTDSAISALYYKSGDASSGDFLLVPISNGARVLVTNGHPLGVQTWLCGK